MFRPGTLRAALERQSAAALVSGALQPLATRNEFVEHAGVRFLVRVLSEIDRPARATLEQSCNPFLPYDRAMWVADVSETHVALLNKFKVIDHHLLIVTRRFEDQETPLSSDDFEALWLCMAEYDALAFYNAGEIAGASQPHKHLQMVPLPLADGRQGTPIDPLLHRLPFAHAVTRIGSLVDRPAREAAAVTLDLYHEMLRDAGAEKRPYNLLVTRSWMLLVPRSRERFESVSVNALGFAGALLVRDEDDLRRVTDVGPMNVLQSVGVEL